MTESTTLAIITAIPPTLLALAAFLSSLHNNKKAIIRSAVTDAKIENKGDILVKKADEIHELTNSNLTKVKTELALALGRIDMLEQLLRDKYLPLHEIGRTDSKEDKGTK